MSSHTRTFVIIGGSLCAWGVRMIHLCYSVGTAQYVDFTDFVLALIVENLSFLVFFVSLAEWAAINEEEKADAKRQQKQRVSDVSENEV